MVFRATAITIANDGCSRGKRIKKPKRDFYEYY